MQFVYGYDFHILIVSKTYCVSVSLFVCLSENPIFLYITRSLALILFDRDEHFKVN